MRNRIFGLCIVLALMLLLVAPAVVQAVALPGWQQRNVSGFGSGANQAVAALETFNGRLYAGTSNDSGAQVWRTDNGVMWSQVNTSGFDNPPVNGVVFDMIVFNGQLYAGTGGWYQPVNRAHIYRTADGTSWAPITGGWGADPGNAGMTNFAIFGNRLYAATFNPITGLQVWSSATGNSNDWQLMATNAFGQGAAYQETTGLTVFNGYLYAAVEGQSGGPGAQIWRTNDGATWNAVVSNGFGNPANYQTGGFATFNGYLYVGTRNDATGGQIWRSSDGTSWFSAAPNGFGDPNNFKIEGLVSVAGLFAYTDNNVTGTEVWRTVDGVTWGQANVDGYGISNNHGTVLWSNGATIFGHWLFLGTFNQVDGGQVWSLDLTPLLPHKLYLPMVARG